MVSYYNASLQSMWPGLDFPLMQCSLLLENASSRRRAGERGRETENSVFCAAIATGACPGTVSRWVTAGPHTLHSLSLSL